MRLILIMFLLWGCDKPCNKKGSLAEKINWAGHNCKDKK